MIDAPGRKEARFPPHKEEPVRLRIARQLARWKAGARDTGLCGGARGADILFAEECIKRRQRVILLIALPEEEFLERSVRLPGSDWEARYRALRARCETHFQHEEWAGRHPELDVFSRNNLWCIEKARSLAAPQDLYAVLVWDEQPAGDGPGGTSDFADRIAEAGGHVAVVNPLSL
jgi:hypothetical protein